MNKGYLSLAQSKGHTMLKDEPDEEDLTYLAPTAGDTCIPLENSPFDMFDDFILTDNYCSLLGDDLANGSPVDSLTADSLLLSSPEPQESDSSCEQSSVLTELSLDALDSVRSDNEIDDGHSPFIPLTDELPVLEPAVMWAAFPDNVSMARPQPTTTQTQQSTSPAPALQRLLAAPPTGPPPQDLITSIYSDQGLIPSRSVSSWETGVKRVLNQEEEPRAKRTKRSPSPALEVRSTPSSSVLMNLLDVPQPMQVNPGLYRLVVNQEMPINNIVPAPVMNLMQKPLKHIHNSNLIPSSNLIPKSNMIPSNLIPTSNLIPKSNMIPTQNLIRKVTNPMSPLTLNVESPMYSLPSSPNTPNYSPAMSPAQRERVLSPYRPQSVSPVGKFKQMYSPGRLLSPIGVIHGSDPYLTNKMIPSPNYPQQVDMLIDNNIGLTSNDFWTDTEMLTETNLLEALDDVKLV